MCLPALGSRNSCLGEGAKALETVKQVEAVKQVAVKQVEGVKQVVGAEVERAEMEGVVKEVARGGMEAAAGMEGVVVVAHRRLAGATSSQI